MKLITISWDTSYNKALNSSSCLYQSYLKYDNPAGEFLNFHFNVNDHVEELSKFRNRFPYLRPSKETFFLFKIIKLRDILMESSSIDQFILCDKDDVILNGNISNFLEELLPSTMKTIVGVESRAPPSEAVHNDWELRGMLKRRFQTKDRINAGVYMCLNKEKFIQDLGFMIENLPFLFSFKKVLRFSEQTCFHHFYACAPDDIMDWKLDYERRLVLNTLRCNESEWVVDDSGRLYGSATGVKPLLVHDCGRALQTSPRLIESPLGYQYR